MADPSGESPAGLNRLQSVVWGTNDSRVRAAWRVVLPWPVLWFLSGTIAVATAGALVPASLSQPATMLAFGLFQAGFFAAAWVAWARFLDRRPLANYGLAPSGAWLLDLLIGFVAVLIGFGAWLALGSALGWAEVMVSLGGPATSLVFVLAAVFVAIIVNVWVQETVFIGITVKNAAEGLASRGVVPSRAVVGAWAVAVLLFALKHRPSTGGRVLNLLLALGIFGLLYVHTGELALPIGVHTGVNYAGQSLFASPSVAANRPAVFEVTNTLQGLAGSLNDGAIPQLLLAYLLLLGWLRWRRGAVTIERGISRWRGS